eukprot:TRINITY_DN56041_c0_g1_i1.p1 TRINITY_DN56041_c0_g1~~TRINITY_DN56041_c0_g1_i1.p1  ORF type:complete len:466 (-),score=59.31 TRINITY_DN56041_c0_g1_i1:33-1235(-)
MPAEWEKHSACLILFPHNADTFRLKKARKQIAHLAIAIATQGQEPVYFLCQDDEVARDASKLVFKLWKAKIMIGGLDLPIFFCVCPSNDTWARDTAPTFVYRRKVESDEDHDDQNHELIGMDWDFNAYGGPEEGCYWPCDDDRKIASTVCSSLAHSLSIKTSLKVPIILEGGSIHTDGEGTLLVTEECLLNSNRNPHLGREDIEEILQESLGISKVLWLVHGLDADEDTNGHVDNFCCFAKPGHVILAWTDVDEPNETGSPNNYQRCRQAEEYLQSMKDAKGRSIEITKLYLPDVSLRYTQEEALSIGKESRTSDDDDYIRSPGEVMAASYINFYIANQAILVPQFATKGEKSELAERDQQAIETLQTCFPDRTVVGIPSREILLGGGNIHCQTQQVPSV